MKKLVSFALVALSFVSLFSFWTSADNTLFCKDCGKQIAADSNFCQYCGTKVTILPQEETDASDGENSSKKTDEVDDTVQELTEEETIYLRAKEFFDNGDYTSALRWFKKNKTSYKDTKDMINECYYLKGKYSFDKEYYREAAIAFKNCSKGYKDADVLYQLSEDNKNYYAALEALKIEDYTEAYFDFSNANGIYDSEEYLLHFRLGKRISQEKYIIVDNIGNKRETSIKYEYSKGKIAEVSSSWGNLCHVSNNIMTWVYQPYDYSSAQNERYTYNEDGSLKSIEGYSRSFKDYTVKYIYDDSGRITAEDTVSSSDAAITYYNYNSEGQLISVKIDRNYDPSAYFYYNPDGTLRQIQTNIPGYVYTIDYKYEFGLLKERNVASYYTPYLKELYEYDTDDVLLSVTYDYYDKTNGSVKIEYTYDDCYYWVDTSESANTESTQEVGELESSSLSSGEIFLKKYGDNPSTLTVANTTGKNCFVLLFSNHGVSSLAFYVRSGENCSVEAPIGTYYIYIVTGDNWQDTFTFFGDSSAFYKIDIPYTCYAGTSTDVVLGNNLTEISQVQLPVFESTWTPPPVAISTSESAESPSVSVTPIPEKNLISKTKIAYDAILNLSETDLNKTSLGNYQYNGITLRKEDYSFYNGKMYINSSCMYNNFARNLSAWCTNDGAFYSMASNEYLVLLTGHDKVSNWEDFQPEAIRLYEFIKEDATEKIIMKAFEKLKSCEGVFNYSERNYSFVINDLTAAAEELGISDTMLGYTLAYLMMYPGTISFNGNSCTFELSIATF